MKATMDEHGTITLEPENSIEAFAMKEWESRAVYRMEVNYLRENSFIRGSMLVVKYSPAAT